MLFKDYTAEPYSPRENFKFENGLRKNKSK